MGVDLREGGACLRCATCDGFPCRVGAKSDAEVRAIDPALATGSARLATGVRVERLGRSSITYALGLFDASTPEIAALGHWAHVYIDRATRSTVPIPAAIRDVLTRAVEARP